METQPSVFAWRIPWTEEPGALWSTESQRVGCGWSDLEQHAPCSLTSLCKLQMHHGAEESAWAGEGRPGFQSCLCPSLAASSSWLCSQPLPLFTEEGWTWRDSGEHKTEVQDSSWTLQNLQLETTHVISLSLSFLIYELEMTRLIGQLPLTSS